MQKCALCERTTLFDFVNVPMVGLTESGQPADIYRDASGGPGVLFPLCAYHLVFLEYGFIMAHPEKGILFNQIPYIGEATEEQLVIGEKNIRADFKRRHISAKNCAELHFVKAVRKARIADKNWNDAQEKYKKENGEKNGI